MTGARTPEDEDLVERSQILDEGGIKKVLRRMAFEIAERSGAAPYLVGIRTRGAYLAERIARILDVDATAGGGRATLGAIDITLYRDDAFMGLPKPEVGPTELPESIEGRTVVLVDDVLYTGRTVRAAMDVLLDWGRPRSISLAVLVDRGCRELPIHADVVGVTVQTTRAETVRVMLSERDGADRVVVRARAGAEGGR